jgi:DNA-binding Xre family transcriptional regulator
MPEKMPSAIELIVRAIRYSTLDAICKTLNCQPGEDIISAKKEHL